MTAADGEHSGLAAGGGVGATDGADIDQESRRPPRSGRFVFGSGGCADGLSAPAASGLAKSALGRDSIARILLHAAALVAVGPEPARVAQLRLHLHAGTHQMPHLCHQHQSVQGLTAAGASWRQRKRTSVQPTHWPHLAQWSFSVPKPQLLHSLPARVRAWVWSHRPPRRPPRRPPPRQPHVSRACDFGAAHPATAADAIVRIGPEAAAVAQLRLLVSGPGRAAIRHGRCG